MKEKTEKNLHLDQQGQQAKASQKGQQDRQKKNLNISLPKFPKGLMIFLSLLGVAIASALLLFFSYHVSYRYWLQQMGDGAYKYSDKTYQLIEDTIRKSALQEEEDNGKIRAIGMDILTLQNILDLEEIVNQYNSEHRESQVNLTLQDLLTLEQVVNQYNLEKQAYQLPITVQELLGLEEIEPNPNSQSSLKNTYNMDYADNQTKLVYCIQDGYYQAIVTAYLDKDFTILNNSRNFNSREEYMNSYWDDLELRVLKSTLLIFAVVAGATFLFFGTVALIYSKVKAKKEKKASSSTTSQEENPEKVHTGAAMSVVLQR